MINATKETATKTDIIDFMLKHGARINEQGEFYREWPHCADFMGKKAIYTEACRIGLVQVMADDTVWMYSQEKDNYSKIANCQKQVYQDFDKLGTELKNNVKKGEGK